MNTPYFLVSTETLDKNISEFQNALNDIWSYSKIAYSVKTNSLPWILQYLKKHQIMAETVSDEEYQLAKLCGYSDEDIVFNGPIKGDNQLDEAIKNNAVVNIDSANDLEYICNHRIYDIKKIGVRININPEVFLKEDIGYENDGFRFGFSEENGELKKVIDKIYDIYGKCQFGLHLHCNSITRSVAVYKAIASYAAMIINKYSLEPSFIDIGGGFFGGVEGKPSAKQYILAIKKELDNVVNPQKTMLIIEPGSAIIGSAVDLYTSVIDVKDTLNSRIVTTDGSRIHIDPLWKKTKYMYSVVKQCKTKELKEKQIICGYTCMDHDRMMIIENQPELKIGDKIVYHRIGAYSMTFGGPFIRYFPDVYADQGGNTVHIRKRMSVNDYLKIME